MMPSWRMQPQGIHANSPHRQKKTAVIQKRHRSSPASSSSDDDEGDADHNGELPLLHRTKNNNSTNDNDHPNINGNGSVGKKRRKILYYMIPLLLLFTYRIISGSVIIFRSTSTSNDDDASIYGPPTNDTNPFIARYEHSLLNNLGDSPFIPLLYENDKLLCRRKHKVQLSRYRTRYFAHMVRTGLAMASKAKKQSPPPHNNDSNYNNNNTSFHTTPTYENGLPILVIDWDENGCNIQSRIDNYVFPRLTWSDLSPKHATTTITSTTQTTNTTNHHHHRYSCNTISIPSYETYKYYHRSHHTPHDWERTFAANAHHYPWQSKLPKAVWRGSTTYEGSQFTNTKLEDTPRGQLVLIGKDHEDIMDVGFHKILQQYANDKVELAKQFPMKSRMSPKGYMRYRGM